VKHLLPALVVLLLPLASAAEALPLQQWIDEAIKSGGGVVTIPLGEHLLPKGLVLKDAKKLALRGMDKERCVLKLAAQPGDREAQSLIAITGASETIEIANLTLDGGRDESAVLTALVHVTGAATTKGARGKDVTVRDCILQNFPGCGVLVNGADACTIERSSFRDGAGSAVTFGDTAKNCVARGNHVIRADTAFDLKDASACLVEGNEARECRLGVHIWHQQGPTGAAHIIRNNGLFKMTGTAIQVAKDSPKPVGEGNATE